MKLLKKHYFPKDDTTSEFTRDALTRHFDKINEIVKFLTPSEGLDPKGDAFIEFMEEGQGISFIDTPPSRIADFQKKLIKKHAGKPMIV